METNPLNILADFLNKTNKPISYSLLRNLQVDPPKHQHLNYIDSIVNDNNFIVTYSKAYKIKQKAKKSHNNEIIQNWLKKYKFPNNNIYEASGKENDEKDYEKIIMKIIRNQAAIKIQRFFYKFFKIKRNFLKDKNTNKSLKMGKKEKNMENARNFLKKSKIRENHKENLEKPLKFDQINENPQNSIKAWKFNENHEENIKNEENIENYKENDENPLIYDNIIENIQSTRKIIINPQKPLKIEKNREFHEIPPKSSKIENYSSEIKTLMHEFSSLNNEDMLEYSNNTINYQELDDNLMRKFMNYYHYQNNRLKHENEYIKTNL